MMMKAVGLVPLRVLLFVILFSKTTFFDQNESISSYFCGGHNYLPTHYGWTWTRIVDTIISGTAAVGCVSALTSIVTPNHNAYCGVVPCRVKLSRSTRSPKRVVDRWLNSPSGHYRRKTILHYDNLGDDSDKGELSSTSFPPPETASKPVNTTITASGAEASMIDSYKKSASRNTLNKSFLTKSLDEIDEQRRGISRPVVEGDSGWVDVVVKKRLTSGVTPKEAHHAWLQYVWRDGGGLPVIVVLDQNIGTANGEDSVVDREFHKRDESGKKVQNRHNSFLSKSSKNDSDYIGSKRLLLPIGMEETICSTSAVSASPNINQEVKAYERIQSKVTKWGLLRDIEKDTHVGTVTFAYDTSQSVPLMNNKSNERHRDVIMTWKASCYATSRKSWWQAVSEKLITEASSNLQAYLKTPWVYTLSTKLERISHVPKSNIIQPADFWVAKEWVNYVWIKGGDIPLPMLWPIMLKQQGDKAPSGSKTNAEENSEINDLVRVIVPPFLKERLVSLRQIKTEDNTRPNDRSETEIIYTVDNPSIWTFYPVHSHIAKISFQSATTGIVVEADQSPSSANEEYGHERGAGMVTVNDNTNEILMTWRVQIRPYANNLVLAWFAKAFTSWMVSTLSRNFAAHIRGMNQKKTSQMSQNENEHPQL